MSVRPCSECGGSGNLCPCQRAMWDPHPIDFGHTMLNVFKPDLNPCPRCAGMPKLAVKDDSGALLYPVPDAWDRGWFFPGPDTVMWWCFAHSSFVDDLDRNICEAIELDMAYIPQSPPACDPGWTAMPVRLETVE